MTKVKAKGQGRPPVFVGAVKTYIINLLKKTGNITHTRAILAGAKGFQVRNRKILPKPLKISVPTLRKFAAEANIEFDRGRPAKAA